MTRRSDAAQTPDDRFDFAALRGGRAFPAGFDPIAIAKRHKRKRRRAQVGGALAAAGLAVAAIAAPLDYLTADHRASVGSIARFALPDGTAVALDSGGRLSWRESATERRVILHAGAAVFETAADPDRRFIVETPDFTAEAHGTIYGVAVGDRSWSAAVAEGAVAVRRPGGEDERVLRAGETAYAAPDRPGIEASATSVESAIAWRDGRLAFRDAPLSDVLAAIDRYRPGAIVLMNDDAATRRFDGVLSAQDVDDAIAAVAASSGLTIAADLPFLLVLR